MKINILPQPSFNKSFNFLIDDLNNKKKMGYSLHLCCTNTQQKNRLNQIFTDLNNQDIINPIILPISKGFIDNSEKHCFIQIMRFLRDITNLNLRNALKTSCQ